MRSKKPASRTYPNPPIVVASPSEAERFVLKAWAALAGHEPRDCVTPEEFLVEVFREDVALAIVAAGLRRTHTLSVVADAVLTGASAPVLYIADREHDSSLDAIFAAGASDYVVRVWDPDDLFARAARLLEISRVPRTTW